MIENKQVSPELFNNEKLLNTLREVKPFTDECLKKYNTQFVNL